MTEQNTTETNDTTSEENNEGVIIDNEGNEVSLEEATKDTSEESKVEYPEWLPEKFQKGENWAEELNKSYSELEKTLKEKGKVAPDEYQLGEDVKVNTEDEVYDAFKDFAKESNLSNDQFNEMLKFANESGLLDVPNYEEEMAKLGKEGQGIIDGLKSYSESKLKPEEQEVLDSMIFTADQAKLLNKIIRSDSNNIPPKVGNPVDTKENLQAKLSKLMTDPDIRTNQLKKDEAEKLANTIAGL